MVDIRRPRGRAHLASLLLGAAGLALAPRPFAGAARAQAAKAAPVPQATAPTAPPSSPAEDDEPEATVAPVTVIGKKLPTLLPGAVVGDIKPEESLSPSDVQSYGVSTVTELLNELTPETRSDRGRGGETPVILLNGRRISSLSEIQNIPTEALLRVDILPEEVSLKYGYSADQRVVNFVLRRRFRAITGEAVGGGATEGGREQGQAEVDQLRIRGDARINLDLKYVGSSEITDASRGIVEATPGAPFSIPGNVTSAIAGGQIDPGLSALTGTPVTVASVPQVSGRALTLGDFAGTANQPSTTNIGNDRTLSPATQSLTANGVWATFIPLGIRATFNGTLAATDSNALQGLSGAALGVPAGDPFSPFSQPVVVDRYDSSPLRQDIYGWTAHLGSTLNRDLSDWRLSLTDTYDHAETWTDTDTGIDATALNAALAAGSSSFNPFAPGQLAFSPQNTALQTTNGLNGQVLANGPLFKLPAGPIYVSAKAGDTQSFIASQSNRFGVAQSANLSQNDFNAQLNVDVPLTSDDHHVLGFLGDLSVNANAAIDEISDYGVLKAFGYGLNWTPIEGYNLIVSHTNDQAAPTLTQLGGAIVQTPDVTVFDYATGRTVNVTQITGGNPSLEADNRNVFKVGLTIKPFEKQNLTFTANFIKSDIDHPIETFPAADAAIEAAFPNRFPRDADGDLEEEDLTPVNFARSERTELRWGFDYSRPIGPQPPPRTFRRRDFQRRPAQGNGDGGGPPDAPGATPSSRADGGAGGQGSQTGQAAQGPSDSGGSGGGPGGGGGGFGGGRGGGGGGFGGGRGGFGPGGRFQIAVYHTIYFVDRMIVSQGGPVLDLLNGSAASSTGGQYRNEIEGQLGATLFGFGGRISADWRSSTSVDSGAGSQAGALYFSGITTINARYFENFGQQPWAVKRMPWLRGARLTVAVLNLFDQRISVKDALGETPLGYQPGYIDPVGRVVTISLRKLFF